MAADGVVQAEDLVGRGCGCRNGAPSYPALLEEAYALGVSDGAFAGAFESVGLADPVPATCRGRSAEEFADLLWGNRAGRPPRGLAVNAPLWYARGFTDGRGLATRSSPPSCRPPAPVRVRPGTRIA
jgi:hypothetical protein